MKKPKAIRGYDTLRGGEPDLDLEISLRGQLAIKLIRASQARRMVPVEMLADIIEHVLNDDLISAVLDTD